MACGAASEAPTLVLLGEPLEHGSSRSLEFRLEKVNISSPNIVFVLVLSSGSRIRMQLGTVEIYM